MQGRPGLPTLHPTVYQYMITGKCTDINVSLKAIPDAGGQRCHWPGISAHSATNTITHSHSLILVCNHSCINSFRYSFFICSAFLWNSLPSDLVQSISYNSFKLKLKHYYLLHWNNSLFYSSLSLIFVLVLTMLLLFLVFLFLCRGVPR